MALTEIYCNPAIAGDSGAGTSLDPYGDFQYMLNERTWDNTNGNRLNVKVGAGDGGTDEVLTGILDWTGNFVPGGTFTQAAPVIMQGYTSGAGDAGIGGIDGDGSNSIIIQTSMDFLKIIDMHLHNCGAAQILNLDNNCLLLNCEFNNTSGDGPEMDAAGLIENCHFHDIGGNVDAGGSKVFNCYFKNDGTNEFNIALVQTQAGGLAIRNTFSLSDGSSGIQLLNGAVAMHNSIFSPSGTGGGITQLGTNIGITAILNNLIDGFNGAGGLGIGVEAGSDVDLYGMNAVHDVATTEYSVSGRVFEDLGDNEILTESPFDKSGADSFTNRFGYYSPVNTGNVRGGAHPTGARMDKGAVQHADPAGGGGLLVHPGTSGGARG